MTQRPESIYLADNGAIPNSPLPLLLYRSVVPAGEPAAIWLERTFQRHRWTANWRNGIFPYHHYHSTTHEVLGVYAGSATVQVGGEDGPHLAIQTGDVLVIPAGVGHKNKQHSPDFGVVGGYPDGRDWDLLRGAPGERPAADQTIAAVPRPVTDPLLGVTGFLPILWK